MRIIISCVLVLGLFVCLSSDLVGEAPSSEQVRKELKGKSMAEVINALGVPDDVNSVNKKIRWGYNYKTIDPFTGKEFKSILIWFMDKKVTKIDTNN